MVANRSYEWASGRNETARSSGPLGQFIIRSMLTAVHSALRWVVATPLGGPVVPDV